MKLTTMDVYGLCNKHQWFTCGSVNQYEKMFDYVRDNEIFASSTDKISKLATMIWICSNGFSEEEIYNALYKKALENKGVYLD